MNLGEIDNKIIKIIPFRLLIDKQICSKGAKKSFLFENLSDKCFANQRYLLPQNQFELQTN